MGNQWERVRGANLDITAKEKQEANKNVFESDKFKNACTKASVNPTKRQASKFNNKKGASFKSTQYGK